MGAKILQRDVNKQSLKLSSSYSELYRVHLTCRLPFISSGIDYSKYNYIGDIYALVGITCVKQSITFNMYMYMPLATNRRSAKSTNIDSLRTMTISPCFLGGDTFHSSSFDDFLDLPIRKPTEGQLYYNFHRTFFISIQSSIV